MLETKPGFTIVELLIVIVVIGILAGVTVAAYGGVQNRAHDSAIRSNLSNLAKQFELFKADNGAYPSTVAHLESLDVAITKNSYKTDADVPFNLVPCVTSGSADYALTAISKSGTRFYIGSSSGLTEYTGATSWLGSRNYSRMCTSSLSGSAAIAGSSSGYGGSWRVWSNG